MRLACTGTCTARMITINQCGESGMIYSGSESSFEFSEFRIRIQTKVPDPDTDKSSGSMPIRISNTVKYYMKT